MSDRFIKVSELLDWLDDRRERLIEVRDAEIPNTKEYWILDGAAASLEAMRENVEEVLEKTPLPLSK